MGVLMANNSKKDTHIFIFDAEPGMIISRDIFATDGKLIAGKETKLDIDVIAKISSYQILEIYVYEKQVESVGHIQAATASVAAGNSNSVNYYDRIRSGAEFKKFQDSYNDSLDSLTVHLDDILNGGKDVDTNSILGNSDLLISANKNKLRMLDMLHSIRQHSDSTYAHCVNVAIVASIIGHWLKYSDEDIEVLITAGLLHDIGKLTIDASLVNKPGKLTPHEYEILKAHVNNGHEYIKDSDLDPRIKDAVLLHHEKCDGSGYPYGLKSSQIPPFAKIIAIADIYDAMTAKRSYRGAICPFEVIHLMEKEAFTTLDPEYVLPFLKNIVASYLHTNVQLSDGRTGEVILINDRDLSRPIVKCGDAFIDLSKETNLIITAIL